MNSPDTLQRLGHVELLLEVEGARPWTTIGEVLALAPGSMLWLDAPPAEAKAIRAGGAIIGWGEPAGASKIRITRLGRR